jgi:2-polyprenyl-3-methyl-5-hydroxy-6-metoxy-1,4-benzoquinol methylase
MNHRVRARELAAEYIARGDPKGWFEQLYREAGEGKATVPWADRQPNPNLVDFWNRNTIPTIGKTALTIGCGLGDDAEQLAAWGFHTTAFDVSESAIRACRHRFPASNVNYIAADLFSPPDEWIRAFDFVFESYTLQVLPPHLRERAIYYIADFVRDGSHLLVITRARGEEDGTGQMPWPLTRGEVDAVANCGLQEVTFEDYFDLESPPVRRFRALYKRG